MYRLIYVAGGLALATTFAAMLPIFLICLFLWGMIALIALFI
jgi:hypothetical protein